MKYQKIQRNTMDIAENIPTYDGLLRIEIHNCWRVVLSKPQLPEANLRFELSTNNKPCESMNKHEMIMKPHDQHAYNLL